ncbi:MAG TPA: hypothetical protein VFH85_07880 [Gammaproteobacteria bacterium]|nr:hypothetical protein [Gammaproteobacteria bacterium]
MTPNITDATTAGIVRTIERELLVADIVRLTRAQALAVLGVLQPAAPEPVSETIDA